MICAFVLVIFTFLPDTIAVGASGRYVVIVALLFALVRWVELKL